MTLSVSDGNSDNMVANLGSALAGMHTDDGEIGDNRLFQNNGHSNKSQSAPLGFNRGQMSAATPNTETPSLSWGLPTTDNTLGDNSRFVLFCWCLFLHFGNYAGLSRSSQSHFYLVILTLVCYFCIHLQQHSP